MINNKDERMEKIVEQGLLFDFYGELLTDHQKKIYGEAISEDLSLSELAEAYGISRQGVHDLIKRCDRILSGYEEKLQLVEKFLKTKENVNSIYLYAKQLNSDQSTVQSRQIEQLAEEILCEL